MCINPTKIKNYLDILTKLRDLIIQDSLKMKLLLNK